jgi:hypothetical protein
MERPGRKLNTLVALWLPNVLTFSHGRKLATKRPIMGRNVTSLPRRRHSNPSPLPYASDAPAAAAALRESVSERLSGDS